MTNMTITTILQVYKRPQYLQEQLDAIERQTVKSNKLIIVHNEGGVDFKYPRNAQIIYASPNMHFHLRYTIALLADTNFISFLDDDTIVGSKWYENCLQTIAKHDCIVGTNGRIVDRKNQKQYGPGWANPKDTETEVDFVGHAVFLKRSNLKYMFFDDILESKNGEDIMLSANLQRFANIPTYVPPQPLSDREMWGSLKGMEYGADSVASYIVNPTHNQERYKLFDDYAKRGWKMILEK